MLGEVLRKAREEQNLTIEDLERETSIRKAYIAAIEEEKFDALPSDVYVKGFIRNLSRFLHTDGDALISEFIELRRAKINEEKGEVPTQNEEHAIGNIKSENITLSLEEKRGEKARKSNLLVVAVLILALLGAGAFYFMNKGGENLLPADSSASSEKADDAKEKKAREPKKEENKVTPPQKNVEPQKAEKTTQVAAPTQNTAAPQNAAPTTNDANAPIDGVEVVAGIDGAAWIKVIVDGNVVFEDVAADGSVHTWKGKDSIIIRSGNAGAVKITHNGKDEGAMGEPGQVAEKAYKK